MIDAHIHIDFFDKPYEIIRDIVEQNISTIFVTHLPELYEKQKDILQCIPQILLAVGFHPILANEYKFRKDLFVKALESTRFVGEVGLDFYVARTEKSKVRQRVIFEQICMSVNDHILSIHSRQADEEVFDLLQKYGIKKAIFHWYTGAKELIPNILDAGYYFSVNPSMLKTSKGRRVLKEIPLNRLLIETDGPFSKFNGKIIEPMQLKEVYNTFEEFYKITDIESVVSENMEVLLQRN